MNPWDIIEAVAPIIDWSVETSVVNTFLSSKMYLDSLLDTLSTVMQKMKIN